VLLPYSVNVDVVGEYESSITLFLPVSFMCFPLILPHESRSRVKIFSQVHCDPCILLFPAKQEEPGKYQRMAVRDKRGK
jgi:hypothetical protein